MARAVSLKCLQHLKFLSSPSIADSNVLHVSGFFANVSKHDTDFGFSLASIPARYHFSCFSKSLQYWAMFL